MSRFLRPAIGVFLLVVAAIAPIPTRAADASTVHKQIGVHAGLCVLVGKDQAKRALALAKVSDLVIYLPATSHSRAAAVRAAVESAL